jgi:hypothetical protein
MAITEARGVVIEAVRASTEVVFDASPEAILDVFDDIEALPTWPSVYQ